MGATVLGCGHSVHLFEAVYLEGVPQVHVHFLTDEEGFEAQGYGLLELVCHGCGASRLIVYDARHTHDRHVHFRDRFRDEHVRCVNRGFESYCPDYRRTIEVTDTRRPVSMPKIKPRMARSAR